MKLRHILLALLALLAIAFMQPLVTLLGGLTLLLGVGGLIYRDLSPASQDAVERRLLGWLRRVRADTGVKPIAGEPGFFRRRLRIDPPEPETPAGPLRRGRAKSPARRPTDQPETEDRSPTAG